MLPQHVSTVVGDFEGASPTPQPLHTQTPTPTHQKTKKTKQHTHTTRAQFDCIRRRGNKARRRSESQGTAPLRKRSKLLSSHFLRTLRPSASSKKKKTRRFPCLPPPRCAVAVQLCGSSLFPPLRRLRPDEFPCASSLTPPTRL